MSTRPTKTDDTIDSRDIIAAIEELTEEIADLTGEERIEEIKEEIEDLESDTEHTFHDARFTGATTCSRCGLMPLDESDYETECTPTQLAELREELVTLAKQAEDNAEEIAELREELKEYTDFAEQAEGYASDWHHGATLIHDSHFKAYAQQYAEETGAVDANAEWPNNCIDWDEAATELQADYSAVEFDGETYWMR